MGGDRLTLSLGSFEDVVEFLLESCGFGQRPVRIFLMAEYHIFEHGFGDPE